MLQAKNGRQLNLAAKTITKFFTERNISVKHSDALALVARLAGFASYEAARAALDGQPSGVANRVSTWRDLAHAIGTLDEAQQAMSITVSEGCDENGNAEFFPAGEFILARDKSVEAATDGVLAPEQPILLFQTACAEEYVHRDAERVAMQFEVATHEPGAIALRQIKEHGLEVAIARLNRQYETSIAIGDFIAYSASEKGYWNADFGFVYDKASATGYATDQQSFEAFAVPADLVLVRYDDVSDITSWDA